MIRGSLRTCVISLVCMGPSLAGAQSGRETSPAPERPGGNVMTVDFSKPVGPATQRASGLLLGMTPETPIERITPLKVRTWRSIPNKEWLFNPVMVSRMRELGIKPEILCSTWLIRQNIKATGRWPGDKGDWSVWERSLAEIIAEARRVFQGFPQVQYDIWNEPDRKEFWGRSRAQWLEAYRRGVGIVRSKHPGALVAGPSFSNYNTPNMSEFLVFASAHKVLPDVLTWHDLGTQVSDLASNIGLLKKWANGKWATDKGVHLPDRIEVNEIGADQVKTLPAIFPIYFANIERHRLWGACKASWNNHKDLGQMLTPENQPRSVWWVYKSYADITGKIMTTVPSKSGCDGVVGYDADELVARLLVGCGGPLVPLKLPLEIRLLSVPTALIEGSAVRVRMRRIRNSGEGASQGPEAISDEVLPVRGGEIVLSSGAWAGRRDALLVQLSAPVKDPSRPERP